MTKEDVDTVLKQSDVDGDGDLNFEEFRRIMHSRPDKLKQKNGEPSEEHPQERKAASCFGCIGRLVPSRILPPASASDAPSRSRTEPTIVGSKG